MKIDRGFLAGKKTYIVATASIVASWLGYAIGEPVLGQDAGGTLKDAVEMTVMALLAMTFRAGMNNAVAAAVQAPEPTKPEAPRVVDVEVVRSAMEQFVKTLEKKSEPIAPPVSGEVSPPQK